MKSTVSCMSKTIAVAMFSMALCLAVKADCESANAALELVAKVENGGALSGDEAKTLASAIGVTVRQLRFVVLDAETKQPIAGAVVKGEGIATSELPVHRDSPEKTTMKVPFEMRTSKDGKAEFFVCGASSIDNIVVLSIADGYENTSYEISSFDFGKIHYLMMARKK